MAVPTQLSDLSATAASNSPAGGDTVGTTMDDYIRAIQSIIVRISAGTDAMATPNIGAATGTSLVLSGLATVNGAFTSLGLDDNATAKALTLSGSGANSVTIANSATNPTIGASAGRINSTSGFSISGGASTAADVSTDRVQFKNNSMFIVDSSRSADAKVVETVFGSGNFLIRYANDAYTDAASILAASGTSSRVTAVGLCYDTNDNPAVNIESVASQDRYITLTGSNGGNPTIGTSAGGLQLNGSGGTGLLVDATGNVGLNTTAGFSAIGKGMEIQDASVNVGIRVERTATGASAGELYAGSGIVRLNTSGAYPIGLGTNNIEQVRILDTASADRFITLTGANAANPKIATSAGALDIGSPVVFTSQTVGTTVGAAGGASALPATPLGYLTTAINGTACKIPYYTA